MRLLFGEIDPSGRLPFTLARDPGHYPFMDKNADEIVYDLRHGYPKFLKDMAEPRYPFGHGLTYGHILPRAFRAEPRGDAVEVSVSLHNPETRPLSHAVQVYLEAPGGHGVRWPRKLVAFTKCSLQADEVITVELGIPKDSLACRDSGNWITERGDHRFLLADNAEDPEPLGQTVRIS